ncbi:hypothetical protein HG530_003348 [Fusarium avenaceum]|nr:hypothetical protein HG530_003348 [Fusarium avenaceum]
MFRPAAAATLQTGEKAKMFWKRTSEAGGSYYVVNKKQHYPKRPKESEYFQINDLLLDLDDMFSKTVRPVEEEDDIRALKKWSRDYKREGIQGELHRLERTLEWSRLEAFNIRSGSSNSWRLGSHDIFSAALRAPSAAPLIARSEGSTNILTTKTQPNTLHRVCSKNGISHQIVNNDPLLLQWLKKQTQLSESEQISKKPRSLPLQFSAALKSQDSITSMRRLVSQLLSSDPSSISWLSTNDISSDIRDACETLWKPDVLQTSYDLLVFLGNLDQRLLARGSHIGGSLCGFGLRLSAAICKPSVTRKYHSIGSESGYWTECEQGLRDIHDSLETYLRHFSTTSSSTNIGLLDRQGLLKLLIGDADQGSTSLQESFRSLIMSYLRTQGESKQGTMQIALSAYRTYIVLLGHLGARALLLYEKRASATIKNLLNEKQGEVGGQAEAIVTEALQTADNISVVAPSHDAVSTNLNMADCAMLDLEAIEKQGQPQR